MLKVLCFLILCILMDFHSAYGQPEQKFFRKDYHFIESMENFYKIHTIPRTWQEAKQICEWEGATLFYPETDEESVAVLKYMKETHGYNQFWIGISSLLATGVFESIDGLPLLDVHYKWGRGEPNNRGGVERCVALNKGGPMNDERCWRKQPFVCKKPLTSLEWNIPCKSPYTDYIYNETLGRCYKFHLTPKNWTEAYTICSSELSFLAVIETEDEAEFLRQLTGAATKDNVRGDSLGGVVYLGFHNMLGDGWRTIKGTSLENSGYSKWGEGQPDVRGDAEKCGAMSYAGLLNDLACDLRCFFICEHDDVDNTGIDDRF